VRSFLKAYGCGIFAILFGASLLALGPTALRRSMFEDVLVGVLEICLGVYQVLRAVRSKRLLSVATLPQGAKAELRDVQAFGGAINDIESSVDNGDPYNGDPCRVLEWESSFVSNASYCTYNAEWWD
jgi:hypothetical protein